MGRIWSATEGARNMESWGPGMTRQGRLRSMGESAGSRYSKEDFHMVVLESWCYTRKGFQRYSRRFAAQFQGYQFPRRRQKRSWRPGITPDAGVEVVLKAWCYTRAAGTEMIHVVATGFQGIPDCVTRYKFPRI